MSDNLISTALTGKCVGAFAATTVISNNGVSNKASLEAMKDSNFYYFYYTYLKKYGAGASRSDAFFEAQKSYAKALLDASKKSFNANANYQFNIYNLLCYENFGVLSSNSLVSSIYNVGTDVSVSTTNANIGNGQGGASVSGLEKTDGKPKGNAVALKQTYKEYNINKTTVNSIKKQSLDNGYTRFTVKFTLKEELNVNFFDPPDGKVFMVFLGQCKKGENEIVFDIKDSNLKKISHITFRLEGKSGIDWFGFGV